PNSPAADQGIMVGDEIISLNTIPKLFLSLQKIQNILAKKPSKSVKIKLKRGKKLIKTQFTLRNLI
ncbi:MAG TPA: PDZ domain-containing protein, partial [Saprospiraceae bacterium]|nr:PDZ domain-containing protein [Saprospiraceae bacterium]